VTNAANIILTGHAAEIFNNVSSTNALSTLAANASTGMLSLQKGQVLATAINLSNAGKLTVGATSGLNVGGSYTQTTETTTVDGTITAPGGMTLQKGSLVGQGTPAASLTSSAIVTAGDTKPGSCLRVPTPRIQPAS